MPPRSVLLLLVAAAVGALALDERMFVPGTVVANAGSCADPCPSICVVQCARPCAAGNMTLPCLACLTECRSICLDRCDESVDATLSLLPAAGPAVAGTNYAVRVGHASSTTSYMKQALLNTTLLGGAADVLLLAPSIACTQTLAYALVNISGTRGTTSAQLLWLYKSTSCSQILSTTTLAALTPIRRGARINVNGALWQNLPWGRCSSVAAWPCLALADCPPGTAQCVAQPSVMDASIAGVGDTATVEAIVVVPPPEPNDGPPVLPARCNNTCLAQCINGTCAAVCATSGANSTDCTDCRSNCLGSCRNGCDECEADNTIVTLVQSAGTPPADPCASYAFCQFGWSWRAGYQSDDPAAPVLYVAEWSINWPQTSTTVSLGAGLIFCTSGGLQNAIKVVLTTPDFLNTINYTYATGGTNLDCPTLMRNFSSPFSVPGFNPVTRVAISIDVRIATPSGFRRYINEPSAGLCESPPDQWCTQNLDCGGAGNSCQRYPIYLDKVYACNTTTITITPQPTLTSTRTPSPTATPTPSNTPTPSTTPSSTATNTPTQTPSQSQTPSQTPSQTGSQTPTGSPSPTVTPSFTPSPSETATLTPTQSASGTAAATPTASATRTPSQTPSTNATPTPTPPATPSMTAAATSSPSVTPSLTPPVTPSETATPTVTASATPTPSATQTISGTSSPSQTASVSTSLSPSATRTASVSASLSATRTASVSASLSATRTASASISLSATRTASVSASLSATRTASTSISPSTTRTASASASHTPSPSTSPPATASASPTPSAVPKKKNDSTWWIPLVVVGSVLGAVAVVSFIALIGGSAFAGPLISWENSAIRAPRIPTGFDGFEL